MSSMILRSLCATTAITLALPAMASAQDVATSGAAASDSGEIIVTARREAESLQDVPVSVQVVTGDALQKQAITSVEEISKLAPGLTLVNAGSNTGVTLRGVTWQPGSGTPATPIYFNEVPFDPAQTIVSLFDVGQIEVLRGPQGTSRGAPSISGAVTITTRKPDLEQFGGYIQGLYGSADHWDVQGAVNIPIIKDMLAVRFATNIEESDANRIYSVNSSVQPKFKDRTYRATVLFKPTDTLTLQAMYQRRRTLTRAYTQVAGTGSPGFAGVPGASPAIPAHFNGPALTLADRASVQDLPSVADQHIDLLTVNASWEVFGHTLSYNYGRQFNRSPIQFNAADPLNILPGFEASSQFGNVSLPKFTTHEVRLSSLPDADRPFEYDIGWFSKHSGGEGLYFLNQTYLAGAFGSPATAGPGASTTPNQRYVLNSNTNIRIGQVFDSFYGNVRAHIDERTEFTAGLSIVRDRVPVDLNVQTFAAFNAFANPLLPSRAFCPFAAPGAIASPVYTTGVVCEVGIPDGFRNSTQHNNDKYTAALYNFSLSHKFGEDLLIYATTGSSFRTGLPAINNPGLPANLTTPLPETAKSYELGAKFNFGRRLRINGAIFQLDYKNQLTTFEGVNYYNTVSAATAQTSLAFYRNINARVRGFELEIAGQPIDNLSLSANLSYSQIKSQGGQVPCNNPARPINAANPINFCASPKGQVLNTQAPFQASVNGGYEIPFSENIAGYFRFNVNYQGNNPNFGNFRTGTTFKSTPSYAIVDLFAGLTGNESGWDLGVYAKNVFDKQVELGRVATINSVYTTFAAPAGYDVVRASRPREIGVTLRYALGSR
ncbi:TonB-dependent receptor [Novosphingobium sp. G106]|uniref:TonB-dependent receptor n=1 Tax=Novosphingobium sp. G106 TaxID=2849500 RepID=UPI001C2D36C4|nr:TonB-dependent receptor [Novosphingobium sp. G106]MBV1687922.1 TonB-dependent receptor [Novosphingobium sp. G106]